MTNTILRRAIKHEVTDRPAAVALRESRNHRGWHLNVSLSDANRFFSPFLALTYFCSSQKVGTVTYAIEVYDFDDDEIVPAGDYQGSNGAATAGVVL